METYNQLTRISYSSETFEIVVILIVLIFFFALVSFFENQGKN